MTNYKIKSGIEGTIKFWDLPELEMYKRLEDETAGEFLERINDPSKWLYGSQLRDKILLRNNVSHPRFAHLARKAFIHYGGEHYNPHEISYDDEFFMRCTIGNFIAYKVSGRVEYDWELIDNFLMMTVSNILNLDLRFNQDKIDKGFTGKFRSAFHDLDDPLQ